MKKLNSIQFEPDIEKKQNNFNFTPKLVSFRELVKEINNNSHYTHSTHFYPAKFIPQVVRYCISAFSKEKDWIIDPFAGSGTTGLEAYLCNRNSYLLELNPILGHILPIKIYKKKELLSNYKLLSILNKMEKSQKKYYPKWTNLEYWYEKEILESLSYFWGYQKNIGTDIYSLIIETSLLKASKQFSYAEHKLPKLFKSKRKKKYIQELYNKDWKQEQIGRAHV